MLRKLSLIALSFFLNFCFSTCVLYTWCTKLESQQNRLKFCLIRYMTFPGKMVNRNANGLRNILIEFYLVSRLNPKFIFRTCCRVILKQILQLEKRWSHKLTCTCLILKPPLKIAVCFSYFMKAK